MVDTTDLKSVDQLVVRVQVPLPPREWRQASKIFGWGKNNSWNFFPRESLVNDHREEREQERKTKVIVQLEQQNNQPEVMKEIFGIINLVLKFDVRDNPNGNGETYSLI